MKLFIAFGVCAACLERPAFAQSAEEIRSSPDWTQATIFTDGGSVYSKPDFDAPISDYLPIKMVIWITKKAMPGNGGLGLFHKVRYKSKAGYMADTDIRIINKDSDSTPKAENTRPGKKKPTSKASKEEKENDEKAPLFFKHYVGLAIANVDFTEKFGGKKLSDNMWMYGLRATGPGTLFDGPPLDFNFWFSLQSPGYYKDFASGSPKGFLLFGDLALNLPLSEWKDGMVNYGIGPMWTYTNYKVSIKNSHFDSQEIRIGVDLNLGATFKISSYALKADVKYYFEKTQYFGFVTSFQTEY